MEEIVSSVAHETVNQIISGLINKYEQKSNAEEHTERLEMAHIKLETALVTSNKWHITDAPLLRWQKKLKRVAEECDDTLRKCRQRVQKEVMEQEVRDSSITKRIAHATKSLVSSIFNGNIDELSRAAVRRFERFAGEANEFLRFVEFGGTPRRYLFFDPLIRHLLAGERLEYRLVQRDKHHLFALRPCNIAERGTEAKLIYVYKDGITPEENFYLSMMLQVSESTNIIGITFKCLQLFPPHFNHIVETVRKELTQLPTQDFSWVPYVNSWQKEHWDNIHDISTQWFRPNPLCCKQGGQKMCGSSNMDKLELPNISLEPVIEVYLQCQVSLSRCNKHTAAVSRHTSSPRKLSHLKIAILFMPHGFSNEFLTAATSSAVEVINGEEQGCCHTNITLEQLDEIMLPKAIDTLSRNPKETGYQMLWKSKHEGAFIHVGNTRPKMLRTPRRTTREARKSKLLRQQDHELTDVISDFFDLWVAQAPVQLQGSIVNCFRKKRKHSNSTITAEILENR